MLCKLLLFSPLLALLVFAGCKVSKPGSLESSFVKSVKRSVTIGGKDVKSPLADTAKNQNEGAEHFQHHCQICHGLDGHATGVPFAQQMSPPVPDLSAKDIQDYTDGQLKWIIENGIGPSGMPAWKGILEDDEMWKIVTYIRHLPTPGSLGAPGIFKEEAEEHEAVKGGHTHAHGAPDYHNAPPANAKPPLHHH